MTFQVILPETNVGKLSATCFSLGPNHTRQDGDASSLIGSSAFMHPSVVPRFLKETGFHVTCFLKVVGRWPNCMCYQQTGKPERKYIVLRDAIKHNLRNQINLTRT